MMEILTSFLAGLLPIILLPALALFIISACIIGMGIVLTYLFPITISEGVIVPLVVAATAAIVIGLFHVGKTVTSLKNMLNQNYDYNEDEDEDEEDTNYDNEYPDENDSGKTLPFPQRKVGRNDPCPCKSGKKYKYCCGR